jgi:preprotein translocase subunit SecA
VTYGSGYELGFDFLRDQLSRLKRRGTEAGKQLRSLLRGGAPTGDAPLQRGHACAIIDEIDSVLVDEAGVPLILSESDGRQTESVAVESVYRAAQSLALRLDEPHDFQLNRHAREIMLTQRGVVRAHRELAGALTGDLPRPWTACVENALRANYLLRRDVDYVVQNEQVQIVDEFTGRIFSDRTWRDGLHQAVEAKEGLPVRREQNAAARISRQRYFRLYDKLCGMTGTALSSRREFRHVYQLPVVQVPLRSPSRRTELPARYFRDREAKVRAMVLEIAAIGRAGRPVLIGSRTIENSELVSRALAAAEVPHRLLNGRQDADEAAVIAEAGARGAVTIATNMAGRGTDIRLGPGVAELGGLHLIAMERHESTRIDRQLIGRVARQGDLGSYQFFVSADDALLAAHGPPLAQRIRQSSDAAGESAIDWSADVMRAQRRAEASAAAARRQVQAQDNWHDEILEVLAKR